MTNKYHSLAGGTFSQDWTNPSLISVNDDWSGVPSIEGFRGDDLTAATGADPQTLLGDGPSPVLDVNINQTNPATFNTGGVTEFALANPTIALAGSATADAPYIVLYLDATGQQGVTLAFNARDLDGSVDNAVQQIAVHYRIGTSGSWTNLPAGYIADATSGPSQATLVTPVTVTLPAAADNQAQVQVRIMTTNAVGNDEWVGIDDIVVTSATVVAQETLSIAAATADRDEGDAGTTAFSFTVTRTNADGDATAAWNVTGIGGSGQANAADFSGALSGTVSFAAGETSQTITIDVAADTVVEADETFAVTLSAPGGGAVLGTASATGTIRNDDALITPISEVQGAAAASLLVGQIVTVRAVVVGDFQNGDADTKRNLQGFYLQEEDADADTNPLTSEGLFVFQPAALGTDVKIGDVVRVTGTVSEFFGLTQLTASTISVLGSGAALPTAAVIDLPAAAVTKNQNGAYQPDLEAYEGMRVSFGDTLTITEQFNLDRSAEIRLVAGERPVQFTNENLPSVPGYAASLQALGARTITYDDGLNDQNKAISNLDGYGPSYTTATAPRMGDTIAGLEGVLDYQWAGFSGSGSTWRVRSTEDGANSFTAANPREETVPDVGGRLQVASFNVLNYFTTLDLSSSSVTAIGLEPRGANSAAELTRQTEKLVTAIQALDADILGLLEMENDFLAGSPGNAVEQLVNELNMHGGTYSYVYPGTQFQGGDAIAVAYIYNYQTVQIAPGTTVERLDDSDLSGLGLAALLSQSSVGAVFNGANTSRAALAVTWEERGTGETFTTALNHFKSKSGTGTGADADALDGQGNWNNQRLLAATAVDAWMDTNPTGSGDSDVLILGDLNAYFREDPIRYLEDQGYENLQLRNEGAYSYTFDGQIGALDQMLANKALAAQVSGVADWHINSDEADALDYNLDFGRDAAIFDGTVPFRVSDHDPVLIGLNLSGAAPDANDDTVAVDEDGAIGLLTPTLLGNDTGNGLRIVAVDSTGTIGGIGFTEDGGTVSYSASGFDALAPGETATDSFTYTIEDGQGDRATATVTVTVTGVNDGPVAQDDMAATDEDGTVLIDVLANDSDIDGGTVTLASVGAALNGSVAIEAGAVRYIPAANFSGKDSFSYTIADGQGGSATATVTVNVASVNDAPVGKDDGAAVDEDGTVLIDVLANDSDIDGDTLLVASVGTAANGSVAIEAGGVRYTPAANFFGTDSFSYVLSDGKGGSSTATVSVAVASVNDAPLALDDKAATARDTAVVVPVLANDSDIDGGTLSVTGLGAAANGTVTVVPGGVSYLPAAGFTGMDSFAYTVSDGQGGSATATVSVSVTGANRAPVAKADTAATAEEVPVTIAVLANDSDPDGNALTLAAVGKAAHGTVSIVGNQVLYTPKNEFSGKDSFSYTISDGQGGTATSKVSVQVANRPEFVSIEVEDCERELEYREDRRRVDEVELPRRGTMGDLGLPIDISASAGGAPALLVVQPGIGLGVAQGGGLLGSNPFISGSEKLVLSIDDMAGFDAMFAAELVVRGTPFGSVTVTAFDGATQVAQQTFATRWVRDTTIDFDPAGAVGFDRLELTGGGLGFALQSVALATDPDTRL